MRHTRRRRPGAALIEALVALLLVGLAATGLLSEMSAASDAVTRSGLREREVMHASHDLAVAVLVLREQQSRESVAAPELPRARVQYAADDSRIRLTAQTSSGAPVLATSVPFAPRLP